MTDLSPNAILALAGILGLGLLYVTSRVRRPAQAKPFDSDALGNERDGELARRLAGKVGCAPAQVLPAIRREIEIAPGQSDETILKRAEYHYRRDLPETSCPAYQDRGVG